MPKIRNGSLCDSFCASLKIARRAPGETWDFLQSYLADARPYFIRFGVVMLLFYYVDDAHLDAVFERLCAVKSDEYYVRMAVAWAVSMCVPAYPAQTEQFLRTAGLDDFTHNKAVQKLAESRQVTPAVKQRFAALKRRAAAPGR